jgi:hypothetical protein
VAYTVEKHGVSEEAAWFGSSFGWVLERYLVMVDRAGYTCAV